VEPPIGRCRHRAHPARTALQRARHQEISIVKKAYWICFYRSINNQDALAAYAKLALPAIEAGGGRFLARGMPSQVYEHGQQERTVMIEFPSLQQALTTHDSPAYQEALRVLGTAAERDLRLIEAA
jgi:uncharacterized protein (DUF1330 family)